MKKESSNKSKKTQELAKFKQKYFDYYDDIKSHTHKKYDW